MQMTLFIKMLSSGIGQLYEYEFVSLKKANIATYVLQHLFINKRKIT